MNNPGINLEIWKQLRQKWSQLDASGHQLKIDFQLIADPKDKNKILAIDVVQNIDGDLIVETVQRIAREGYAPLGIAELSLEDLVMVWKKMMYQLRNQLKRSDIDIIVTMSTTSPTSGELRGYLEVPDVQGKSSISVNYEYYYVLSALRDKMIEILGETWIEVKAVYHADDVEFYFEYS